MRSEDAPASDRLPAPGGRSWWPDVLGVLWVLGAAFAVLLPPLVHGSSLGPFDILAQYSLSKQPAVTVHNWRLIDQITAIIPVTTQAWTQVHSGHLPLWNPYSLLGLPLAFDWLAAPFSIPSLVGYLFPLHLAYTVQIIVTLIIGGTGMYTLGRVLRLSVLGCVMAATVCELSGPYMAWLGWPVVSASAWAGWLFAAAIVVVRGRHRARSIAAFALVCGFLIYSSSPENTSLLFATLAIVMVVILAARARRFHHPGPIARPARDLIVAFVAGLALGAPLALPGLQVVARSSRVGLAKFTTALPLHGVIGVVFQGFDGLPEANSIWFDHSRWYPLYLEAYVGAIAVVLAVTAVAIKRRSPEVLGFAVAAVVTAAVCFVTPIFRVLHALPLHVGQVQWVYALEPLAFCLAVLAGFGTDVLVRSYRRPAVRLWFGAAFTVMGVLVLAVWLFGRGHLPPAEAAIRARSFLWPTIDTVVGLGVVGALAFAARRARGRRSSRFGGPGWWAGAVLVAVETVFLVTSGAPVLSSSPSFLVPTRAEVALVRAVGSSTVGCGVAPCFTELGILPDVNVDYKVQEFGVYDPSTPDGYLESWEAETGHPGSVDYNVFSPEVTSIAVARRYGISFVLEPEGVAGPRGSIFDENVGNERLYRVPGAASATLTALGPRGGFPNSDARGTPVAVTHPSPSSWKMTTDKATPQVLRLRLTDVPGWHGSIDGRPLPLEPFSRVMIEARIPPGHHVIELHYWPRAFTTGIVLALCSATGLALGFLVPWIRRRRRWSRSAG